MRRGITVLSAIWLGACGGTDLEQLPDTEPETCTEISCVDGVEVFFDAHRWPDGEYVVAVTVDDVQHDCVVQLPPAEGQYEIDCGDGLWLGVDDEAGIWGAHVDGIDHDWIGVEVVLGAELLGQLGFQPDYWNIRPNGDDCPGACQYASETLELPALAF